MSHLSRRAITGLAVMALVFALGATSAWGAGATPHSGSISGVVRPFGRVAKGVAAAGMPGPLAASGALVGASSPGGGSPPLLYWGGPVMHGITTHVIAWVPSGQSFPTGYVSGFETFLGDLQHDLGLSTNISSVAPQYVDASGTALGALTNDAVITDTTAYPTTSNCTVAGVTDCLTESQLLTEVADVVSANSLPVNLDQSYVVLLPPGVDTCTDTTSTVCEVQTFCGYHDSFGIGNSETTFTLLPYTESSYSNSGGGACYDPTVSYPAGQPSDLMALDSIGAHELFESATDPVVEPSAEGYVDSADEEIGDECAWTYGPLTNWTGGGGGTYNQLLNGHPYVLQEMWSNQDNACEQGDSSTPTATVTPGASPVTSSPTSFAASLSGASATGATYAWSYMDPNGSLDQNVASGANPQITMPTAGTYTVWVQVTDAAGGTITGVQTVTVTAAPTAAFGYTTQTAVPAAGSPVSFNNSSSAYGGQTITGSSWNFGDGGVAASSDPTHTYSTPGTYTVTLTVTETNNVTAETSHTITVDAPPTAAFTSTPASPIAGTSVQFTSEAAVGAGTLAYLWEFGDGGSSTVQNPVHTYTTPGTYTVTLTVTQSDGLTASVQHTVTIAAPPPSGGTGGAGGTGGSTGSGGSNGSGGSTSSATADTRAVATAWLTHVLTATHGSGRITTLLERDGTRTVVGAPSASGHVTIIWYAMVRRHRIVVARGSVTVTAGVAAHIVIKLTATGRALFRRTRRVKVNMSGVYRFGDARVTATHTAALRR